MGLGLNASGLFTMASLRKVVDDFSLRKCGATTIWNKIVPTKIWILNWWAKLDKLPTKDNLSMQGIDVEQSLHVLQFTG